MKPTKKDITKIEEVGLKYEDAGQFLHCRHCLDLYMKEREANGGESPASPHDTFHYEASGYKFPMPDGTKVGIVVVWCKKCQRSVWDSRHLTHLY